jgi:hypothetical protein
VLRVVPEDPPGWTVRSIDAPGGYTAAIALETPAVEVRMRDWRTVVSGCDGTAS